MCFCFAAWLLCLIFVYICPIERFSVSYDRKQPVNDLVPYIVDDEAVRVNAKNLKRLGVALEVIAQATGLSEEEIGKL